MPEDHIEQRLYGLFAEETVIDPAKVALLKTEMQSEIRKRAAHPVSTMDDYLRTVFRTYGYRRISLYLGAAFLIVLFARAVLVYELPEKYSALLFLKIISVLTAAGAALSAKRSKTYRMEELEMVSCISAERYYVLHALVSAAGSVIILGTLCTVIILEKIMDPRVMILTVSTAHLTAVCLLIAGHRAFPNRDSKVITLIISAILLVSHTVFRYFLPAPSEEWTVFLSVPVCVICIGILLAELHTRMNHLPLMQIQED